MPKSTPTQQTTIGSEESTLRWLPKFARLLAGPIVTLYVGKERVKYQAHKDMLCELFFFQKALKGPFEEASKNEINMPDDNPAALSALIENLYTGHYKYDPNVPVREFQGLSGPEPPSVELAKPLFHLEVLILADKYEDRRLEREAMYLFADSISVLDTLDKLRL